MESLGDVYPKYTPKGIRIEELSIPSSRPNTVRLSTLLLRRDDAASPPEHVVLYCQGIYSSFPPLSSHVGKGFIIPFIIFSGNAGNPLHRIPVFATLLNAVPSLAILAPAPRSYWTSSTARPTQAGLTADYAGALAFAASRFPTSRLTIYGHSLGATIALCLLAPYAHVSNEAPTAAVHGLVLENAFTSVPDMVRTLYPQRWLPYRYLGPFVCDRWDASAAAAAHVFPRNLARRAMVLVSERDEVVPPAMGWEIFNALRLRASGGMSEDGERRCVAGESREPLGRFVVLEGALHEDAWRYRNWSRAMQQYLEGLQHVPINEHLV